MLYEVTHATFGSKDKRGYYPWTRGREEASSDTLTLILYHMVKGGLEETHRAFIHSHGILAKPLIVMY
jgi:hypothetical protein